MVYQQHTNRFSGKTNQRCNYTVLSITFKLHEEADLNANGLYQLDFYTHLFECVILSIELPNLNIAK